MKLFSVFKRFCYEKIIVLFFTIILLELSFNGCNTNSKSEIQKTTIKTNNTQSYLQKKAKINYKAVPYFYYDDPISKIASNDSKVSRYLDSIKHTNSADNIHDYFFRDYVNGIEIVDMDLQKSLVIPETIEGKKVVKLGGTFEEEFPETKGNYFYRESIYNNVGSYNVKSIYIPRYLKEIVNRTFYIDTLERIEVDKDNPYYSSKDGILYDKSSKIELCVPTNHHSRKDN